MLHHKEEVLKTVFKNKEELDGALRDFFGFEKPSSEEIENWPYKSDLNVSLQSLIGKKCFINSDEKGEISQIVYAKHKGRRVIKIKTEQGLFSLTFYGLSDLPEQNQYLEFLQVYKD